MMIRLRKRIFFFILPIILLFHGCTIRRQTSSVSETRLLFDTFSTITIHSPPDPSLLAEVFSLAAEYEAILSAHFEGSDIWRINRAEGTPTAVSSQTAAVISAGIFYGDFSGGMFDITIGRLSALWDFSGGLPPAYADIEAARKTVDYSRVTVAGDMVHLENPGAWLDLGGIAKGYIADRLADFLRNLGVESAVIDLGGDIVVIGTRPDGNRWRIGVAYPFGAPGQIIGVVETDAAAITTSGIYQRMFEKDGVIYHHLLDPRSGMPVVSDVVSATVITQSAMMGDALSGIAVLVGSEKTAELFERAPDFIGAVLILDSGEILQLGNVTFLAAESQAAR